MEAAVTLASGATDATAKLWSGNGKLLRTLTGHTDRLGRIAFHPMGRHLGERRAVCSWLDVSTESNVTQLPLQPAQVDNAMLSLHPWLPACRHCQL